ncbi:MAG: hypothetical protein CM15mV7_1210 [uncultured marine virus]|nr:MAG: hypothetical protein CM15mV7_1210 [uncultured marine virus]
MSILGTIDASTFGNNVGVTNGDATVTKNAADSVDVGDILVLNSVNYIVREGNIYHSIELHTTYAGSTNASLSGAIRRTAPKAVAEFVVKGGDSNSYELVFVDTTEQSIASNKSRGITGLVGGSIALIRHTTVTPSIKQNTSHQPRQLQETQETWR